MFITGMLAMAIGWNRRMMEDVLYRMKDRTREAASKRATPRDVCCAASTRTSGTAISDTEGVEHAA